MPTYDEIKKCIDESLLEASIKAADIYVPPSNFRSVTCQENNCNRPAYAKNWCNAHYLRARHSKEMSSPVRARKRNDRCCICNKLTGIKGGWGMCASHYKHKRREIIKTALIKLFGMKCSKCSMHFQNCVYDFHHVGAKADSPALLISNASVEKIALELQYCVLLCANCHRIEHNDFV